MERIEYLAEILPDAVRHRCIHSRNYKIMVSVEIADKEEQDIQEYSFKRVRKLLRSVQGNISEDIIADREERT